MCVGMGRSFNAERRSGVLSTVPHVTKGESPGAGAGVVTKPYPLI